MSLTVGPAITLQSERLKYPGMLPREILIFKNWLKTNESAYDSFQYDVRLGQGRDPGPNYPDYIRSMAIDRSKFRADAVAMQGQQPTLIEVKDRAGASAAGQLVAYEALWEVEHPGGLPPKLLLITNQVQTNLLPLLKKNQIALAQVPTDFSSLATTTKVYVPGYTRS